ncbi:SDR family NAD(P)-dependent oxidoreductase [Flagellimonas nanhaiensis]|uniref:SDR family NAD(P)-dependent oxidoreductase n=1 Tax=Flagellimonas nanhaiensis TaxID=2292706 RepID=A0A371JTH5_9FLAO|nr:glucose 1-dehydrogenase [Allomuricauda nanhaiensis]RDY61133.1 SDR family NAD(P)-dependent oxidoreductase [Allomuricauda nanhaiensis]
MQINLSEKNALVTGGSQGIGAEICRTLAECGANVFVNYYSSKEKAEILAEEIRKEHKVNAVCGKANVADAKQVEQMFLQMDKELGRVDILVNNAGSESVTHVLDMEENEWDRVIGINLKGPFLCSQEAGRRMENKRGGVIINISSIHDAVPRKGLIHYCSAKAGLKMFSKCLSLELAEKNIRVASIAPGAIETNMNREEIEKFGKEKFEKWIPQGRIGNVADVANAVAFLASDLADYINGADLYIDGAYMNHTIQYDPRPKRETE